MNRRRLLLLAPLGVAVVAGAGFWAMLRGMQSDTFDPRLVLSPLIGKPLPKFALPGLTDADLLIGRPILVNFFASWCIPCVDEATTLMDLKQAGVPIFGIAYKDKPAATEAFLAAHGNPYAKLAADAPGRVAIDFGVYGVPETYLVDPSGMVRWKYAGALTPDLVASDLSPLLKRYA